MTTTNLTNAQEIEIIKQQVALSNLGNQKRDEWSALNKQLGLVQDEYGYDGRKQREIAAKMAELDAEIKMLDREYSELENKLPGCWVGND